MCDAAVMVSNEREPAVMIEAHKAKQPERVVSVMGVEVHRCVVPDVPRTVRWV